MSALFGWLGIDTNAEEDAQGPGYIGEFEGLGVVLLVGGNQMDFVRVLSIELAGYANLIAQLDDGWFAL